MPTQGRCDQALVTAQLCRQACSSVRPCTRHWQLYEVLPTLERCQAVTASLEVECMGACWAANTPQAATTDVPTRVPVRFSRHSMRRSSVAPSRTSLQRRWSACQRVQFQVAAAQGSRARVGGAHSVSRSSQLSWFPSTRFGVDCTWHAARRLPSATVWSQNSDLLFLKQHMPVPPPSRCVDRRGSQLRRGPTPAPVSELFVVISQPESSASVHCAAAPFTKPSTKLGSQTTFSSLFLPDARRALITRYLRPACRARVNCELSASNHSVRRSACDSPPDLLRHRRTQAAARAEAPLLCSSQITCNQFL